MNLLKRLKRKLFFLSDNLKIISLFLQTKARSYNFSTKIIVFDTALESDNLGDEIIHKYCESALSSLGIFSETKLPTHRKPKTEALERLKDNKSKFIFGTNIISCAEEHDFIWHKPKTKYLKNLCLLGCGANDYEREMSLYSRMFYKKLLSKNFLHSVRDSYTENLLKNIGIGNVINTVCPTMWNLTPDFCKEIPRKKSKIVVTTLTDYKKSCSQDFYLLDMLLKNYDEVFIWIQGNRDLEYLAEYHLSGRLKKIDHTLYEYENFLKNTQCDYIGTRLHAGIRALNEKKRTIIIAVDERAVMISKDTNLPVIKRSEIKEKLQKIIDSDFSTDIKIPLDAITKWKNQFKKY